MEAAIHQPSCIGPRIKSGVTVEKLSGVTVETLSGVTVVTLSAVMVERLSGVTVETLSGVTEWCAVLQPQKEGSNTSAWPL